MEQTMFNVVFGIGFVTLFLYAWWKLANRKTPEELACSASLLITGMAAWGIAITVTMFIGFIVSVAAPSLLGL